MLAPTHQGKMRLPPVPKVKNSLATAKVRSSGRSPSARFPTSSAVSGRSLCACRIPFGSPVVPLE